MSEANGPTVVVVTPGEGPAGEGGESGEVQAVAAVAEVSEAAVEIAAIEAGRDVAIAEIQLDETIVRNEAYANEDLAQCRTELARLEGENTALRTELETLRAPLILAPLSEPLLSPEPPPSVVEAGPPENPVDHVEPAPEPPKPKRQTHRWI